MTMEDKQAKIISCEELTKLNGKEPFGTPKWTSAKRQYDYYRNKIRTDHKNYEELYNKVDVEGHFAEFCIGSPSDQAKLIVPIVMIVNLYGRRIRHGDIQFELECKAAFQDFELTMVSVDIVNDPKLGDLRDPNIREY